MTKKKKSKETLASEGLTINGWHLFAHPLLLDQLEKLIARVEKERAKNPKTYKSAAPAKVLAALFKLLFEAIPENPMRDEYRQGDTLGSERKHWFRAKFGGGRFRLFFRYSSKSRVIIFAWVNDENSLREYGAKTDAYRVFASMLDKGNPPDDWDALLAETKAPATTKRLQKVRPPTLRESS